MSILKTGAMSVAFMVAADIAMAGGMGMIGVHGFVVDGGASLGEAWGVPQLDWTHLWEEWEFATLDPEVDPCLSIDGHWHGNSCHVLGEGFIDFADAGDGAQIASENLLPEPSASIEPEALTFGS